VGEAAPSQSPGKTPGEHERPHPGNLRTSNLQTLVDPAMANGQHFDLAEHIDTIIELLVLFAGIAGLMFWRMFTRMEKKVDDIGNWILGSLDRCSECKKEFLSVEAFNEWKNEHLAAFKEWRLGRDGSGGLWEAINKIREKVGL
jgi:hypothetical protein